jgi:hypothetical protein
MNWTIALLLAAMIIAASVGVAEATISRGCTGKFFVKAPYSGTVVIWTFEGRGTCRNSIHANDCRRAARSAIGYCVQEAWRARWQRTIPAACRETPGSSRPFVKGLAGTAFGRDRGHGSQGDQDFKWEVERAACCRLNPLADQVTVSVSASAFGDTGCAAVGAEGSDWVLEPAYVADCRLARQRGFCARRVNP